LRPCGPTKQAVLERHKQLAGRIENLEPVLQAVAGQQFYNTSPLTFTKLLDDPNTIADSLHLYIGGFSAAAKDIIEKFEFGVQIDRLRRANVLYQVIGKFAAMPSIEWTPTPTTTTAGSSSCETTQRNARRQLAPPVRPRSPRIALGGDGVADEFAQFAGGAAVCV
jgi:HsdM N-terminal domain